MNDLTLISRLLRLAVGGILGLTTVLSFAGTVWRSGNDGYHTYRIPALVRAADGTLLAFCEGRKAGRGDAGNIDLLVRRSSDGGRTWSPQSVIWDDGPNTCGNPAPVLDSATGTVWLLMTWNLGSDHEPDIIAGTSRDTRRVYVTRSADHGRTWAPPREITGDAKATNWTWYATGPGAGIRLNHGAAAGRLVIPCDHIEAETRHYYSHVLYSDDHGATWRRGGRTPRHQVNECQVVELPDGRLLLNMRNYDHRQRQRQIAWSTDAGLTWHDQRFDEALIEPICQASLRRIEGGGGAGDPGTFLAFSNPASRTGRSNLTLRASLDLGRTWPRQRVLHPGPSAYSDLVDLGHGVIGCLYEAGEKGPYEAILFDRVPLEDLRAP